MAKKFKEKLDEATIEIEEAVDAVEEVIESAVEEIVEEIKEVAEVIEGIVAGTQVEIKGFYVRAFNGLKGIVTGTDSNGNTEIDIEGGSKAVFRAENLKKVD